MKKEITEWTHVVRTSAEDCHYRNYLVSAATLLQYIGDCTACFTIAREGVSGLIVNYNANFREKVGAMEELHIKMKLDKVGNTSRRYSFVIEKTIEYVNEGPSKMHFLEEPIVVADGTVVLVAGAHS